MTSYDAVIIGGGPGGTALGAILARRGLQCLLLEAAPALGGRARTFYGEEFRDFADMESTYSAAGVKIYADAQLRKAVDRGALSGYKFELGEHGIAGSHLLRIGYVAKLAGAELKIVPNVGSWWEQDGRLWEIEKGKPLPWMDPGDYEVVRAISRAMMKLTDHEVDALDDVPFRSWLDQLTHNEVAKRFHGVMGTLNTGPVDARLISTGEHLRTNRQIIRAGAHITWAGIGFPVPGYGAIGDAFGDAFVKAGGELRLGSPVEKIEVEGGRVVGVRVAGGLVRADAVVSSLPVPFLSRILEPAGEMAAELERFKSFIGGAALTFYIGCSEPIVTDEAWYSTPRVAPASDGFVDDLVGGWIASSNCVPARAPATKQLLESWCGLLASECEQPDLVQRAIDANWAMLTRLYPKLNEVSEWKLITLAKHAYPVLPTPGQVRLSLPDTQPGWYEGLFLVGDTTRSWGCSVDRVMHSALICAEKITGDQFLDILPDYMR